MGKGKLNEREPQGLKEFIRELMRQKGESLRSLASKAGVSYSLISKVMNGRRRPTALFVKAIAKGLDVSQDELISKIWVERDAVRLARKAFLHQIEEMLPKPEDIKEYVDKAARPEGEKQIDAEFPSKLRMLETSRDLVERFCFLYECFKDKTLKHTERFIAGGALLYFIVTLDAVPDFMPLGFLDDIAVLTQVIAVLVSRGVPYVRRSGC